MVRIDIDQLLEPISPDEPCGENLEYDAEFGELERTAQPVESQQIGDAVIEGEEPDWRAVARMATHLMGRTKDLRVAVLLTRALLVTEGLPGFCQGLAVLRGLLEQYWEPLHPELDPDDDLDPTLRINTLLALCDHETCLRALLTAPLLKSVVLGTVTYRDYLLATGELSSREDETPREKSDLEGVFLNEDADELLHQATVLQESLEAVQAIESSLTAAVGVGNAASFEPLESLLGKMHRLLQGYVEQRGLGEDEDWESDLGGEDEGEGEESDEAEAGERSPAARRVASDEIRSRQDVTRMLDKICEYYEKHEPSSPVPLLLKRAKRVANMTFLELLRELTPAGVEQAESLGGISEESGY